MLWREVQRQIFRVRDGRASVRRRLVLIRPLPADQLWLAADSDLLSPQGYRLVNTGQGLNRVQVLSKICVDVFLLSLSFLLSSSSSSSLSLMPTQQTAPAVSSAMQEILASVQVKSVLSPLFVLFG